MPAQNLQAFGGMMPAVDERLLGVNMAAYAKNVFLDRGHLVGQYVAKPVYEMVFPAYARVYRIPLGAPNDILNSFWMEFPNVDTDIIRSPTIGDQFERYYWMSPSEPPQYNTRERIIQGDPAYKLGVPGPPLPPGVVESGGVSEVLETRSYVYTWVTLFGEESAPSPPTTLSAVKIDAVFEITLDPPNPNDLGFERTITKTRIYRTVTSAEGVATFFLVMEFPVEVQTVTDDIPDDVVVLNNELESTNWAPPPADLVGMIMLANGMIAAWRSNELWFCEPYRPHAWPAAYSITVEYPIVALGAFGQTLVVLTQAYPLMGHGVHPSAFTLSKLPNIEPCTSRGSVVSAEDGVFYCSGHGLVVVTQGQSRNLTKQWATLAQWNSMVPLYSLRAGRLGNSYYSFGSSVTAVDVNDSYRGIMVTADDRLAISHLTAEDPMVNIFNDPRSAELFYLANGLVYWLDQSDATPYVQPYIWRSKIFQAPNQRNFAAVKIYFDTLITTPEQDLFRNTNLEQELDIDQYGVLRVYASTPDMPITGPLKLVQTREIRESGELLRLPSGFKADYWQFEIEARVRIFSFQFGTSVKELANA